MYGALAVDSRKQKLEKLLSGKIYNQAEIDKQIKDIREHIGDMSYIPKRACLFGRVSTESEQQESSLFTQNNIFYNFCKMNNIVIVEEIYDQQTGTALIKRPKMQYALARCKADYFDIILFKNDQRFARNVKDLIEIIEDLKDYNKSIRLIYNNLDSLKMNSQEWVQLLINASFSEHYSISLHENLINSMRINMEREVGRVPSRAFGYRKPIVNGIQLKGSEYCEIDPEKGALVLELFNRIKNLEGFASIVRDWNDRGIKTLAGKPITVDFLKRLVKRKIYIGELEMGKTVTKYSHKDGFNREKVEDENQWVKRVRTDLQIVPTELFWEVQNILNSRRERYLKSQSVSTTIKNRPLSGVIKCASCGTSYKRVVGGSGRKYNYFICTKHKDKTKNYDGVSCDNNQSIREDEIMFILKEYFIQLIENKDNIKELVRERVNSIIEKNKKKPNNNVDKLVVDKAEEKFKRAKMLYIDGDIDKDSYIEIKNNYEVLKREYEQNNSDVQIHFDVDDIVDKFCENLEASIGIDRLDGTNGLRFNQLFDSILAYENRTLAVNFKFIYDSPLGGIHSRRCRYDCAGYHGKYAFYVRK